MNFAQARFNMVEQQIRPWHVLDGTVLEILGNIPRDAFVDDEYKGMAYADIEIPLEYGESMLFPRVEGRILQELELNINDVCLEVGTGSGFLTACMATMTKHVHSIDIHDDFLHRASDRLGKQNIANVLLENKDVLTQPFSNTQEYDAIAVTGSIPEYLPLFEKLLKPNGRLFIIVGEGETMHAMSVVRGDGDERNTFVKTNLFETNLKPLVGAVAKSGFTF